MTVQSMNETKRTSEKSRVKLPVPFNAAIKHLLSLLVLDTSGSLEPYASVVMENIRELYRKIGADPNLKNSLELGIIRYDDVPSLVSEMGPYVPGLEIPDFDFDGRTSTHAAMEFAIDVLNERRKVYKDHKWESYKPLIILVTDGKANDEGNFEKIEERQTKGWTVLPIAVGPDVDLEELSKIRNDNKVFYIRNLNYLSEVFSFIEDSFRSLETGVELETTDHMEVVQLTAEVDDYSDIA